MSIEYTIDIQLTEMGFPNIFHPQEASVAETPPNATPYNDSPNHSSSQISVPTKHSQQPAAEVKETCTSETQQTKTSLKALDLAQGTQTETKNALPAQSKAIKKAELTVEQLEEDGSDDSDVSYEEEEVEEEEDFYKDEESSANVGNYQCSVCNLQFPSMFKLQDHMNLHTGARPYSCAECGKRFSQVYNYRVHLRTHAQAKLDQPKCRVCLKHFANEIDLKFHLSANHFEDTFYECDRCKRVFTSLQACEHHVQYSCTRKFNCEKCDRYFSTEKTLKRHLSSFKCYSNLKCTECPKVFTKKNALLKHSFSHLGLLPYTCVRCRCHFRLAKLYLQHKCKPQSIHCVACLREFLSEEDFQQHKKDTGCWGNQEPKGDEIRCLECGQRFDTNEELKKHAGAHQRILKCAECGKGFRSALLLMSHMGGHAGQSPCLCQSCGVGFPHQQNYDSHLKTCGQAPQYTKAPKKHQSTKRTEQEKLSANLAMQKSTLNPANGLDKSTSQASPGVTTGEPAKSSLSPGLTIGGPVNNSASPILNTVKPVNSPASPDLTDEGSTCTDTAKGFWKLSLDKPPPAGVNLVLFLPVCQTETSSLMLPCAPHMLPVSEMQVQTPPLSSGLSTIGGAQMHTAPGTSFKQETNLEPLDLSKKLTPSKLALNDTPLLSVKKEPEEVEMSGEVKSSHDSNMHVQATPLKMDHMALSLGKANASSGQKKHINDEFKSASADPGLQQSVSLQHIDGTPQKKIKLN